MLVFSPKALAMAALTMSLSSAALGCLTISGSAEWEGSDVTGNIATDDNGSQTCTGSIGDGDNDVDCIDGFSLNYDYSDNNPEGPLPITYCNPSGCYGISVPMTCYDQDPSGQASCTFSYNDYC
ncbi:hypothetical protein N7474_002216 [Penicillium riverlandense]|uniref:uncharacterized protein n=1 Tax=Penicillium riverlandense TaxID=1903569 RepID=UPI00254916D8|nr:uncharacterized protein N7474_002216 [Penicillium riverlandense]KAJ5833905.1 hypothetical protein N7474_002216 [Penicillium riverlandense]